MILGISKRRDSYLRTLLIHGGQAVIRSVQNLVSGGQELRGRNVWIADLVFRLGANRAAVAVANKNAQILWVLLTTNEVVYDPTRLSVKKRPDREAKRAQEIRDTSTKASRRENTYPRMDRGLTPR